MHGNSKEHGYLVPDGFYRIREDFRAMSRISLLLVFCFIDAMEDVEIEPR